MEDYAWLCIIARIGNALNTHDRASSRDVASGDSTDWS
jgi:hypothetical protein